MVLHRPVEPAAVTVQVASNAAGRLPKNPSAARLVSALFSLPPGAGRACPKELFSESSNRYEVFPVTSRSVGASARNRQRPQQLGGPGRVDLSVGPGL
jgi:hypothetical protein